MRVFVAGGSGVIGRRLVPQLVARGHPVTATTTDPGSWGPWPARGRAVVMDGLDAVSVGEAVAAARPDRRAPDDGLVESTPASPSRAGRPLVRDHQPAAHRGDRPPAGRRRGGRRAPCGRPEPRQLERNRQGGWVKTEEDPLDGHGAATTLAVIPPGARGAQGRWCGPALRRVLRAGATTTRSSWCASASSRSSAGGTGYSSWVHLDDAASATVLAVEQQAGGRVQHRRRRAGAGQRVAAVPRGVRRSEAADAGAGVAGAAAGRGEWRWR